jgi:hypothetical protein
VNAATDGTEESVIVAFDTGRKNSVLLLLIRDGRTA